MTARTHANPLLAYAALFTSVGTLFCCALPSLLVLAGLGATVASVLSAVPWLVALSHHKPWVFGVSGVLIAGNFVYEYALAPRLRARACDETGACAPTSRASRVVLWLSALLWSAGFCTAFVLGPLLVRFAS